MVGLVRDYRRRPMTDMAADLSRSLDAENPWPGLMPFTEATQAFFHGRDTEAAELLRRVRRDRLTILFGQSGLGKTSLLCAGLFPRLRAADFLPVYLRLDWTTARISPVAQIEQALAENLAEHGVEGRPPRSDETLWGYFHDKEIEFWSRRNRLITPVLVFDQFEEIFTLGQGAASAETLDELAALIENRPPESLRSALDDDPEAATHYDFAKESCKVILALREDFLPDLEGLRRRMPSIIDNRMRLTRMDGRQARDAILASGGHLMAPGVAEKVIAFVAASRGRAEEEPVGETELAGLEIEPALLSIVCSELNNKRIRLGQPQITADLLEGAQQEIVGQFYESSLAGIDPALRLFIEEQLLTAEGYRDTRPLAEALREPGVTRVDIDRLVARRLLRIEERFGTQWVELTHDLLTGVIRQRRDLRREQTEAEARVQAERDRAERAEAEAARERAEREAQTALAREASAREQAARRLVRNTRIALAATVVTLVIALGAVGSAGSEGRPRRGPGGGGRARYALALDAARGKSKLSTAISRPGRSVRRSPNRCSTRPARPLAGCLARARVSMHWFAHQIIFEARRDLSDVRRPRRGAGGRPDRENARRAPRREGSRRSARLGRQPGPDRRRAGGAGRPYRREKRKRNSIDHSRSGRSEGSPNSDLQHDLAVGLESWRYTRAGRPCGFTHTL